MRKLAIFGGTKVLKSAPGNMFDWPIITKDMERGVLSVLRSGGMSGTDMTRKFEHAFAEWYGMKYALGHNNGTAAIHAAMFGVGIGAGDEVICPSITYWASCLPVYSLGGTVVFADIDPDTLCVDPDDIEKRITQRTKAIIAVHYLGMPCDMARIMRIARRHKLKVVEDVSHAHGTLYKGRLAGTLGDVSGFSLMSGKAFAIGEAGMLLTNDRRIYERAIMLGHYERHDQIQSRELKRGAGLPWGGYKYRMHQLSSAVGLVQVKNYPKQMAEIDRAMNYFWDLLEGTPGIRAHRPLPGSNCTMGGWYCPHGLYRSEELGGLSVNTFCEAASAEGCFIRPGCNQALHLHPIFNSVDVYNQGRPTRLACLPKGVDIRQKAGSLPVSEGIQDRTFFVPWFKHYRPQIIKKYAEAIIKVVENYKLLMPLDHKKKNRSIGRWGLSKRA